jgi:glycosyltransferase involved in cell wall biosynthesis
LTEWKGIRSIVRPLLLTVGLLRNGRQADVIHAFAAAHTAFLFGAVPALLVGALLGRPVVLNYHDGRAVEHIRRHPRMLRWAVGRAAILAVPSEFLRHVFLEAGWDPLVVPNVVDTGRFVFSLPRPLRRRLISLRLLEPLYAVENTLRAFALARKEVPGLVLDIYGDGESRPALEDEARRLGSEGITFHGSIPHSEVPHVLAEGGILVNSSRIDNMPLFVIEGFASGVPIISTAAGGIPYMITDDTTGLLVPPDDPEALAGAIRRVFCEPGVAERLAVEGHRECRRYTWAVARDAWLRAYDAALGINPAPATAA